MKKTLSLILALVMCLSLCACGGATTQHTHEWMVANCTTPKTCSTCGETEGSATGHDWKAATCTTAKTCSTCGEIEGNAVGHSWKAATCTSVKKCSSCGITEGTVIDHNYKNGTCTMCGIEDPAVEQIWNASIAYAFLAHAEECCEWISSMISNAWYFAIYRSDDYISADSAISGFSSYVGIEKDLVIAGIDSYLAAIGGSSNSTGRWAALCTNSGALYVVHYALSKNDGFSMTKSALEQAQSLISQLDINYASVNARSELIAYYSAVSAYYDFCYSPSGSYSTLSSTLNGFRTNCANNRTLCSFYFD